MKTICFYCVATHLGGAERSLLDLVSRLEKQSQYKYHPWIILPKKTGPLIDELQRLGIEHTLVEMPASFLRISRSKPIQSILSITATAPLMRGYLSRLKSEIEKRKPHLIHTTGIKCHLLSTQIKKSIPVLWHLRDILKPGITRFILSSFKQKTGLHFVANSKATAEAFSVNPTIPVIYNGLATVDFKTEKNLNLKRKLGLSDDTLLIGLIGALARWKGQLEFITMAERLLIRHSNAKFVIVGDEIYDTKGERGFALQLKNTIKSKGLSEQVFMLGFEKDVAGVLSGLDLLVHASTQPEPFGRVILEGMASRLPVVASAAGGVLEFVENEKNGLLFEPGNVSEMTEQVSRLLGNPELRKKIADKGSETFLSHFTIEEHVRQMIRLFDQIVLE